MNRKSKAFRQYKKVLAEEGEGVGTPPLTKRLLEEAAPVLPEAKAPTAADPDAEEAAVKPARKKSLKALYEEEKKKREDQKTAHELQAKQTKSMKRQKRKQRFSEKVFLQKRTEKGQPILNNQVLHLLKKLQTE
jgi:hypothetical protein